MSDRKSAALAYCGVLIAGVALGAVNLFSPTFMPHHAAAIGMERGSLSEGEQILFRALFRIVAGGWLAAAASLSLLLIFPFRTGMRWADWRSRWSPWSSTCRIYTPRFWLPLEPRLPRRSTEMQPVSRRRWWARRSPGECVKKIRVVVKRGYHHGDLRNALLSEAIKTILESSTAALSLRQIAKRIGVSPAAYAAISPTRRVSSPPSGQRFRRLNEAFEAALPVGDPAARLVSVGRAYIDFAAANPAHYRVMFSDHPTPKGGNGDEDRFLAVAAATFESLRATVAELIRRGGTDRDAWETAFMIWAQVYGAVSLWSEGLLAPAATGEQATEQLRSLIDHAAKEQAKLLEGAVIEVPTATHLFGICSRRLYAAR